MSFRKITVKSGNEESTLEVTEEEYRNYFRPWWQQKKHEQRNREAMEQNGYTEESYEAWRDNASEGVGIPDMELPGVDELVEKKLLLGVLADAMDSLLPEERELAMKVFGEEMLACEEYGASFFENGATPGGVLEHPGVLKDPAKVRESWHAAYGGSRNAGKVAVLEEGLKYQQIGIPPEEAQFLETRKFQIDEIARLYRIPPHMVGDLDKSSFSNIEQQSLEFVKYTLDPWVIRWEQSIQKALFLPQEKREYFVKMNVDGLLRGDYESRMKGYSIGIQNGFMCPNDVRRLESMDLIPVEEGGEYFLTNGNMCRLKDAGLFGKVPGEQEK